MVEGLLFVELGLGNGDRRKMGDGVGEFIPKEGKKRLMSGKTESEREKIKAVKSLLSLI